MCKIKTGRFLFHDDESETRTFIRWVSAQILNRQGLAGGIICFSSLVTSLIFISTDVIATEEFTLAVNDVNQYPDYLSGLSRTLFAFLGQHFPKQLSIYEIAFSYDVCKCPRDFSRITLCGLVLRN